MGWLGGIVMASLATSFLAIRIFEYIFGGMTGWVASTAKPVTFVGVWTAVTTAAGMRDFTSKVRSLRRLNNSARKRTEALLKGGRR